MISVNVTTGKRRWCRPKVVAVFSFRYDSHLVPDLIENIAPLCDGWVSWDDRNSQQVFSADDSRRQLLIEAAHAAGAQWILGVDPDERFEIGAATRVRQLVHHPGRVCWSFRLRELYEPLAYRTDGIWGQKRQPRLFRIFDRQFPIAERQTFASTPLHGPWVPGNYRVRDSGLNLYHLKMIDRNRRAARARLYNALDPDRRYQPIGYDYLSDDTGAVLETIPEGRRYLPPHREDSGLWMADPERAETEIGLAQK